MKPYPVCHFIHAFADAALALRAEHELHAGDIVAVRCAIHPVPGEVVAEPANRKWEPGDEYDAKFSLPYVVAAALVRGRLTFAELDDPRANGDILDLARHVEVGPDADSAFPDAYSGAVEIELSDGSRVAHREQVNRGHDERPLSNSEIIGKFRTTTGRVIDGGTIDRVQRAVLALGEDRPARDFAEECRGS